MACREDPCLLAVTKIIPFSIVAADNNLTGAVPSELTSLASLQRLDLRQNNVTSGLEDNICAVSANVEKVSLLQADCAGEDPEILCSCCTRCE